MSFSHGRGGYRQHNTLQVEELVSHGYIVAAIDHPYAAIGVVFPDGRLAIFDVRMADRAFLKSIIPYLAQDAVFTLDELAVLNHADPNGILTGRLDLRRAGIFGVSLGGAVSADRCKAGAQHCQWLFLSVLRSVLEEPLGGAACRTGKTIP